jgi:diacylglycerol kinase family enzyme
MAAADLCVIFNPSAGRHRAAARLERLRRRWGTHAAFWPTQHAGHAEELAWTAAQSGFSIVAAAGGDGTVHEVANGLLRAGRPETAFAVVPIGSANDYAFSLGVDGNGKSPDNSSSTERTVDVASVRDEHGRQRYFVCCLGLGLNGAVTLESRKIRRLQGVALYGWATLRALWYHYALPRMEFAFDKEPPWSAPTLMLSVLVAQREGGFVLAPHARLDDGKLDYVHSGALSRWEVLRFLPRLALAGPPANHPKVRLGQCRQLRLRSESPLTVHIDGEFFSKPQDNIRSLEVRVLPRALRVRMGLLV